MADRWATEGKREEGIRLARSGLVSSKAIESHKAEEAGGGLGIAKAFYTVAPVGSARPKKMAARGNRRRGGIGFLTEKCK